MNKSSSLNHICFDLDGTLVNSYQTIYKTTLRTLEEFKINDIFEEREFYKRIGHHFLHIFKDLNINVPDIEHFINVYKSFYFDFMDDSTLYPGVENVLEYLVQNNYKVSLLTTKAQDQADKIIEYFHLQKYFSYVMGRRLNFEIKPSPVPLLSICKELKVNPAETLMVGDSELDIRCGKNASTKTCAATYGYRTIEALNEEKPDYIINQFDELTRIV